MSARDRALGAFYGLALGDALGMPTQSMSRTEIARRYGPIRTLRDAVADQPIAPGMPAGSITDDTEQAVLLARLLVDGGGRVAPEAFAAALLDWEADMIRRGSADLLGPSTKRALELLGDGTPPAEAGRNGTTNGAAMRITPVALATPPDLGCLVDAVAATSEVTHNTNLGIAAAAAVAAAVSAGVDGADLPAALDHAERAAAEGAHRGHWSAGGDIASRIHWARAWVHDPGGDPGRRGPSDNLRDLGDGPGHPSRPRDLGRDPGHSERPRDLGGEPGHSGQHRDLGGDPDRSGQPRDLSGKPGHSGRSRGLGGEPGHPRRVCDLGDAVYAVIGTSVAAQESVVAAFALVEALGATPIDALTAAAGLGGDTDTIAAITGAILGAQYGLSGLPSDLVATVRRVNDLHLEPVVDGLLELRASPRTARLAAQVAADGDEAESQRTPGRRLGGDQAAAADAKEDP